MKLVLLSAILSSCLLSQGVAYTVTSSGLETLTHDGNSFTSTPNDFDANNAVFGGSSVSFGSPSKTVQASGWTVRYNASAPGDTTFVTVLSGAGTDVFTAELCITNNDTLARTMDSINPWSWFSVLYPGTVTEVADNATHSIGRPTDSGSQGVAVQQNYTGSGGGAATCYSDDYSQFTFTCPSAAAPSDRMRYFLRSGIASGATACATVNIKFGAAGSYISSEAASAYTAWREDFPATINWPDRRMVWSDFIATSAVNRSLTNPFAYCGDPTFDAFDATDLETCLTDRANLIIAKIADYESTYGIKSQGVILWDLEGFEFTHATTYQGEPRAFSNGYSPIGAVLNNVLDVYKAAGLRVGFTIRPQLLTYVNSLPPTCTYNADPEINDTVIVYSAAWEEKFYVCESGGVTWDGPYPEGNGYQRAYGSSDDATITSLLAAKIQHSIDTYGASIFYMDSNVYPGGTAINPTVMASLQTQFPDVLIFPESGVNSYYQYTSGFSDLSNIAGAYGVTPVDTTRLYPNAFRFNKMQDCSGSCWTNKETSVREGFATGDIMSTWIFAHPDTFSNLGSAWQYVLENYNKVVVTDSVTGKAFTVSANPKESFSYPLVMRVYFASSSGGLAASTLYCEAGRNVNLGSSLGNAAFNGANTCYLDLTGITHYQIRYYDHAGGLKSNPSGYGIIP